MLQNLDPNRNEYIGRKSERSRRVKIWVGVSILVAVIILGVVSFIYRIKKPFMIPKDRLDDDVKTIDYTLDTDGDGLTDYVEENVYHTSAYIEDTDSDGITDKEEVDRGTDPLCPEGKDCNGQNVDNSEIIKNLVPPKIDISTVNMTNLQKVMNGEGDVNTLRKVLIEGGVSQSLVNSISDEELLEIYQQTLENNIKTNE